MAKMKIPLNGSNFVSKNRQQAYHDALADDHQVNCDDETKLTVSPGEPEILVDPERGPQTPSQVASPSNGQENNPVNHEIGQALNHTYNHQRRTMDIHQEYLSQQAEYIQLITAVLDQQGKALNYKDKTTAAGMIETFQRTLDNFHNIREQGVEIHREFLKQQTAFSERYLNVVESGHLPHPVQPQTSSVPVQNPQVTEWVVKQPPIVLDEQATRQEEKVNDDVSRKSLPAVIETPAEKSADISLDELTSGLLDIVAEKTGYPAEMLELDMDLEADLGIDSIKRVEILGSLEERYPALPPADMEVLSQTRTLQEILHYIDSTASEKFSPAADDLPVPQEESSLQSQEIQSIPDKPNQNQQAPQSVELTPILMEIVAEKTGYPAEMLEEDMDMEADLGIDSIKRVEILGAMEERVPGLPPVPAETLAELRTLGQIVELMTTSAGQAGSDIGTEEEKKKDKPLTVENTPVRLVSLPKPDHLAFQIPADRPLILTSDGTDLTKSIYTALVEMGWKTVLWDFPDSLQPGRQAGTKPVDYGISSQVKQDDLGADAISKTLDAIRNEHGIPAGFIHLHPLPENEELFSKQEGKMIKEVFFIASTLQEDLNQTAPDGRNLFLSITRSDGALGLQQQDNFQEGAGLSGLVKSLGWEWPDVFCRSVDFSPELQSAEICQFLLKEIHDPDRSHSEIGLSRDRRVSIQRESESI